MNYDAILKSITSLAPSPKFIPYTTDLLLEIIRAYDEQTNKDGKLLELADSLCTWLSTLSTNPLSLGNLGNTQALFKVQ